MAASMSETDCRVLDEIKATGPLKPRDVARRFNVATETAWRWMTRGVVAPDGRRVRLESAKLGAILFTSDAALNRFSESLTRNADDTPPMRSPSARRRASDAADRKLQAMGC